jgi:NAD(P)-dependent dehydrogenase (short-subunit alcohol dehydrogenase family)
MWGNPILVMGSGGGIGERIDRTLVREDAAVVVHGRD